MRIAVILGTRPEAIKLAPLVHVARDRGWDIRVWWSGQHDEMVNDVLSLFEIDADARLDALRACTTLSQTFAYVLHHVDELIGHWRPDLVWVQGDTTTAAAGALAAFHRGVRVGHVEAGLRTYDLTAPFPEEANRQIVSRVAGLHYAPTEHARTDLLAEHVDPTSIAVTGNTVIDALRLGVQRSREAITDRRALLNKLSADALDGAAPIVSGDGEIILITTHRRENHGPRLAEIARSIASFAAANPSSLLVYPVHPNPIVLEPVRAALDGSRNVVLTRPLGYATLCATLDQCSLVVTDSGGLQEEAASLGVPVVVLRDVTERPEGVEAGLAMLAGHEAQRFDTAVAAMRAVGRQAPTSVYGDGRACERIVAFTEEHLS